MINYLYNPAAVMLHEQTRHSNLHIPYEKHVTDHKFPDQIQELINTEVTLKYRNHNIADINTAPEQYGRPMDDEDYYDREVGPDEYDQIYVYEESFRVVRADNSEPFVLIGISKDYSKVLINSTRIVNGEYEFKHLISILPKQDNSFFGLEVMDKYTEEPEFIEAVTIRTDDHEPCNSVMVEFLGSTNMIRLVTGDECISYIRDIKDDDYDLDGRNADEYDERFIDLDGLYASHEGITAMNIDGGHANNLRRLFFNRHVGDIAIEDLKQEELPEKDVDFGDIGNGQDDTKDDGKFNFGDILYDIEPEAEGDYDMNDDSKEDNYNFHSIDEEPPVEGQDDYTFNFGDIDGWHGLFRNNNITTSITNNSNRRVATDDVDITQIFIDTKNNVTPYKESYIDATIKIIADNKSGPDIGIETTDISIKVRGNSTSGLDKKPYNIKFKDKVEILGFSKGKKYCLLANRYDKSLIRNYLAYYMSSKSILEYTPQFRFVDLVLNDRFMGSYLITTPIEAGKNRLNIDVDGMDALLEREASRVESDVVYVTSPIYNVRLAINEPEEPTAEQLENINNVLSEVDNVLYNNSSITAISEKIDIDSFIDFYIIEEYFKNVDVNFSSTRFYIKNNKLYASPCWDFDLSSGNTHTASIAKTENLHALNSPWIKAMMNNNNFKSRFINRYKELQYLIQKIPYYSLNYIDNLYLASFNRDKDFAGWQYIYQGLDRRDPEPTHEGNVLFLKNWLIDRNIWLLNYFNITEYIDYSEFYNLCYMVKISDKKIDQSVLDIIDTDISNSTQEDINNYITILTKALDDDEDEPEDLGDIDQCTAVGDYDMNSSSKEEDYNFFNLEPEPTPDGADYPEPGEDDDDGKYNFFDIDEDPPVIGPDDEENNFGDLNDTKADGEYYYEGDTEYIECDFDFGEITTDEDLDTYDYGDIDDPIYIIKPDLDSDFGELIPGVLPSDDGQFNFGEIEEDAPEEPEAEGDHDFGDISDKSYIYDDDDETADFGDIDHPNQIDDDDDLVYNFGDIDILPIPEDDKGIDDGQFNFGTIDWIEPYAHEDFDMNDDAVPSEDYDFFDIDEDDPVYGEDDGRFNFIDGDEEVTAEGDYDFNENLDDLHKKFRPDLYPEEKPKVIHIRDLTMAEIIDFRKMVFEGRNIYGSV